MVKMTLMKFIQDPNSKMVLNKIMQVCLISPLAEVDLAHPVGVDGVTLVRVDNNLNMFFIFQFLKNFLHLSMQD